MSRRGARVSVRDVARHAGVSQSSVSRVLNGAPFVSEALRTRVLAAVETLGYRPDHLAQSLRSRTTRTVGFIVGDISNPLLSEIVCGAERVLRPAGYSVLLADSEGDPALDREHVELLARRRVDGLLVSLSSEAHAGTFEALRAVRLPSIFIDREPRRGACSGAVLADHAHDLAPAVDHLLALGHRRIGFVGGADVRPTRERARLLAARCESYGDGAGVRVAAAAFSTEFGRVATQELLAGPRACTALVFGGARLLVGGLREIAARGLSIPDDLSVIACDASDVTRVYRPGLACVERDLAAFGAAAAHAMLGALSGQRIERRQVLRSTFTPGASCAPPRR